MAHHGISRSINVTRPGIEIEDCGRILCCITALYQSWPYISVYKRPSLRDLTHKLRVFLSPVRGNNKYGAFQVLSGPLS